MKPQRRNSLIASELGEVIYSSGLKTITHGSGQIRGSSLDQTKRHRMKILAAISFRLAVAFSGLLLILPTLHLAGSRSAFVTCFVA